ncbi:tripartite tricarboxylate transporter substrate binding protein [Roseomonas sp. KE2513]|uniref:tripartite tricarboxylate transporter substrate binding protein n=1 Tax=Roseomonas sp. KE2513 TaxID=2479202 RepID=UPI0018DF8888|nr:tripartite tricarboxylate transporter substrate binding protein [Roseomonas sp. KE2513]
MSRVIIGRRDLLGAAALLPTSTVAQTGFPSRPIRMVVPFAPGGTSDLAMRALCEGASRSFGQPVVVDNRPGASGSLGPAMMKDARPDGSTLTMLAVPAIRQVLMMARPSFDPITDSTRIIHVGGYLLGVVVRPDSPWRSWQEFIGHARANPGRITYGTSGVTSTGNAAMTRIADLLGIEWTHVPFRGGAESTQALLAGQIDAAADSSSWAEMVRQDRLRLLVTWGPERSPSFPEVPTLRETGTDFTATSPYGIIGPPGMDPALVRALHDGFQAAMRDPLHVRTMARLDMPILYMNTADYEAAHLREVEEERAFIRRLGLHL